MNNLNQIELDVINASLKKMRDQGWFCICTIDKILKVTKSIPNSEDYKLLHLLHCVHFSEMSSTVKRELPDMINRVCFGESLDFQVVSMSNHNGLIYDGQCVKSEDASIRGRVVKMLNFRG